MCISRFIMHCKYIIQSKKKKKSESDIHIKIFKQCTFVRPLEILDTIQKMIIVTL